MYRGKYEKRKRLKSRSVLIAACLILTAILGALGTVAILLDQTNPVTNEFNLSQLPNEVVEEFDGEVKKNVAIQNTSEDNKAAYIRAAVIVNWAKVDADGNYTGDVYGTVPVAGTDYTISWLDGAGKEDAVAGAGETPITAGDWIEGTDGYYYFTMPVAAGAQTQYLFTDCQPLIDAETGLTPNQPGAEYVLSVTIAGQSIQADGTDDAGNRPVILAWGTDNGGSVASVDSNGQLTIVTE